jgi:hypothetical protein
VRTTKLSWNFLLFTTSRPTLEPTSHLPNGYERLSSLKVKPDHQALSKYNLTSQDYRSCCAVLRCSSLQLRDRIPFEISTYIIIFLCCGVLGSCGVYSRTIRRPSSPIECLYMFNCFSPCRSDCLIYHWGR